LLYLIPIEYRLGGKNYVATYNFLKESEQWSREKLRRYQQKQLKKLLEHAVKNVPFYSNVKLISDDPFKNLENFPIIDKETLQKNRMDFLADNMSGNKIYYVATGGTSGNSLEFNLDNSTYGKEWAFKTTGWRRVGFMPGDRMISFRGVEFRNANKGVYWQDNPIYNWLEMSPFHLSEENLPKYIQKIKKFRPKYIHGYPSALSVLADYVEREVKIFPKLKAAIAISENIFPYQRELIERAFNTRLFSFYGMSEKVILAPECEYDNRYHAFPEYGVTEIVDKNGDPVGEGERGELVGTGFLNHCMPFIRYRTGDYAVLSEQKCKCKRNHFMVGELTGRWLQEIVVGKDGALMSISALNLHSDVLKNIRQYQFQQKKGGELIVRIVPKESFNGSVDEKRITDAFYQKVSDNLDISIEQVDTMRLTKRGKHRLLVQYLDTKQLKNESDIK